MVYHINSINLSVIVGPVPVGAGYVRKITRCGSPDALDYPYQIPGTTESIVPEVKPPLGQYQSYGGPVISADAVTFTVVDWTQEQIDAYDAQTIIDRRSTMSCTPRQGLLALHGAGLLAAIEEWIATQPKATQIEYEFATEWRRDWPLIETARVALEWTHEEMDALFATAQTL